MSDFIYLGSFQKGDRAVLVRDLTAHNQGNCFWKSSAKRNETKTFPKGTEVTISDESYKSMTTPESYATYTISSGDDTVVDVPDWFLLKA